MIAAEIFIAEFDCRFNSNGLKYTRPESAIGNYRRQSIYGWTGFCTFDVVNAESAGGGALQIAQRFVVVGLGWSSFVRAAVSDCWRFAAAGSGLTANVVKLLFTVKLALGALREPALMPEIAVARLPQPGRVADIHLNCLIFELQRLRAAPSG